MLRYVLDTKLAKYSYLSLAIPQNCLFLLHMKMGLFFFQKFGLNEDAILKYFL